MLIEVVFNSNCFGQIIDWYTFRVCLDWRVDLKE